MCGINGFFNYSDQSLSDAERWIDVMNECIAHRGPDGNARWMNIRAGIYIGHQRLRIIDLSDQAAQPMVSPAGNVIVFNGEIYNYRELRKQLSHWHFRSQSDTEVLLALYERYGEECLDQLDGMFAFAIWDAGKQELFIARDRVGEKPFYYSFQNGIFSFSSEIKAILKLPWIKPMLDETAFYHFLTFNQLMPPFTMFKGIEKLPPACCMRVGRTGLQYIRPYWEVSYGNYQDRSEEQWVQSTASELEKSIASRMVSDVPVGAFLSGGVDSSAVVAFMSRLSSYRIKTYSIGFDNQPAYDELEYARKIAVMFQTDHYEKIISGKDIAEFVPRMAEIFDEPLADPTCIPIYFIARQARSQGTIVVLTGDGSDEIFCGYRNYLRYLKYYSLYHRYRKLPTVMKKLLACCVIGWSNDYTLGEMLTRAAANQEFFWGAARSFKESTKRKFLSKSFRQRITGMDSYQVVQSYRQMYDSIPERPVTDLDWMCYLGFKMNDPNRYLYRADKLGMAHSVEIRAPFMRHTLVNLALNIPASLKVKNNEPKYILKQALKELLPDEILYRKKMGFSVPLREWAGPYLADYVDRHLKSFCRQTGLFDENRLCETVKKIKTGSKSRVNDLFTIYFLMAWMKRWMNV